MANNERAIKNDDQYQKSLDWLVEEAKKLEDPLLPEEERVQRMKRYDFVADGVQRYKRGKLVQMFPGTERAYDKLGWAYDVPDAMEESKQPEQPKEPKPMPKPARPPARDFLDDD